MKIDDLKLYYYNIQYLCKISQQLHRLNEHHCNYGLTPRQVKRYDKLVNEAKTIAEKLGFEIYVNPDPRGAALWLCEKGKATNNLYTQGLALF